MSDSKAAQGGAGIGLCGAMFLLFLALRLTDHIDWAWYWVAAPLWMPLALVAVFFVVLVPILYLLDRRSAKRGKDT